MTRLRKSFERLHKDERPGYAFMTTTEKATFDLDDRLRESLDSDDHHEGAMDFADGGLLKIAQAIINRALGDVETYHADYSRVVWMPELPDEEGDAVVPSPEAAQVTLVHEAVEDGMLLALTREAVEDGKR